ncbi:MAG: tetratricopeptide repeat protein [Bryobacteraceae bacterium]
MNIVDVLCLAAFVATVSAQTLPKPAPAVDPNKIAGLLETGRCPEALPQAMKAYTRAADVDLKWRIGSAGVRCAMALNKTSDAADFIQALNRSFPKDPDVLYLTVHTYSDLSIRASQELLFTSPASHQVRQLNAEAWEMQGKWDEAAEEYKAISAENPKLPGLHYRLGRLILSKPQTATTVQDAKKEFEEELKLDPANAGAEYVLGELAREDGEMPVAIGHFAKAARLEPGFADAHIGLGRALIGAERGAEAVAPLEQALKLQPANPAVHYNLAIAYKRAGREEDSLREAKLHQEMSARAREAKENVQKGVMGGADRRGTPSPK